MKNTSDKEKFSIGICEEIEIIGTHIFGVEVLKTKEPCYCFNSIKKIDDVVECIKKAKEKLKANDIIGYYEIKSGVLFFIKKTVDK